MPSIKENISNNIIELRKRNKWTQVELGERLNYTDKTISKWERGESTPDAESLYLMSEIFDVPIDYFFKNYEEKSQDESKKKLRIPNNIFTYRLAQLCLISLSFWFVATAIYVYLMITNKQQAGSWIIFIWPIPATFITTIFFFKKIRFHEGVPYASSLLLWSLLTLIYLTLLIKGTNIWPIFIIGIPIQLIIILRVILIKNKYIIEKKTSQDNN